MTEQNNEINSGVDLQAIADALSAPFDERWREIQWAPAYRVSNRGRVQSDLLRGTRSGARTGRWRDLKPTPDRTGHLVVTVARRRAYVHRLVLEAFVGSRPDGQECLHRDGNPANNHLENLRWGTRGENIADTMAMGRVPAGEGHWNCSIANETVGEIRRRGRAGEGVNSIARRLHLPHQTVSKIIRVGRRREVNHG